MNIVQRVCLFLGSVLIINMLQSCATNPATGNSGLLLLSSKKEQRIGDKLHKDVLKNETLYKDENWNIYVNLIGREIAANSDWPEQEFNFYVLDSQDVNAFALPNGDVFITTGMLMHLTSEAHLAAVLAHEIAHVTARHTARKLTRNTLLATLKTPISFAVWATPGLGLLAGNKLDAKLVKTQSVLVTGYGRELELQADTLGAKYLAASGYQPEDMLEVLQILKDHEEYRRGQIESEVAKELDFGVSYHASNTDTHPSADQRLQEVIRAAEAYVNSGAVREDRENYLTMVDGLAIKGRQRYALDSDWAELRGLDDGIYTYLPFTFEKLDTASLSQDHQVYLPSDYQSASYVGIDSTHKVYKGQKDQWQTSYLNSVLMATVLPRPPRRSTKEFLLEYINERAESVDYIDHGQVGSQFSDGYFINAEVTREFVDVNSPNLSKSTSTMSHMYGAVFLEDKAVVLESFGGALSNEDPLNPRLFSSMLANVRASADSVINKPVPRERYEVTVYKALPGDTFYGLAQGIMLENAEAQLRLINGMFPSGEPQVGQSIKVFSRIR